MMLLLQLMIRTGASMAGLHRSSNALLSMASTARWCLAELQPDELQLAFQMRQEAAFDAVPLDPRSCPGLGVKLCT